ncbi:MAG: signal peptide peptidase SppA, partial [Slackia sp.]|nr:signal peptide peptidase SppA [Slackia sp.]
YGAQAVAPSKKSKAPWIVGGVFLFVIVFMFTIGALSCSHMYSSMASFGATDDTAVTMGDTVGVIDVAGTIQYDGTSCSPEGLRDALQQAEDNPDIKAVVLRVDSGGGVATAGEEMAAYVRDFSKPIVVSSASMNCSAAYELSSQADYIFVNETTAIGAIGTIMQTTDLSGLMDMLGISVDNIASAESKDSSYGTRPLTDEERAYYQDLVDTINQTFIENVAEGRGMSVDEVRALATGMQFAGTVAVENGLADEVGIYDAALDKAAELGGIEYDSVNDGLAYDVVQLAPSSADLGTLMDLFGSSASSQELEELLGLLKQEGVLS